MEFILYGQNSCISCHSIKTWMKANEFEYTYVDIEESIENFNKYNSDFPGARSVPRAVIVHQDGTEDKLQGANDILKFLRSYSSGVNH